MKLYAKIALFKGQSAHGTNFYTCSTALAFGLSDGLVIKCSDQTREAAPGEADGPYAQAFPAYPYASAAEDAFIGVIYENGAAGINRKLPFQPPETV